MPFPPARVFHVLFLAGLLAGGAAIGAPPQPWPHEQGDVPPDPAIRWGRLDNGVRFAIRRNAEPAGRVYLILQVAVGSLHEREDQLGYAHFVEHMMFRGTKRFPASSLVGFLQHAGLAFGADTSAFTTLNATFYNLDLPQNSREKIGVGLSILRDFADGARLPKADLAREAKVIESERRTRESDASQVGEALNAYLFPGSLPTRRAPIGTPASVAGATVERLRDFYRAWYRPTRMTVIAVGDADPDLIEKLIREQFASLAPAPTPEPPEPDLALAAPAPDVQAKFLANQVPAGTSSLLYSLALIGPQADTIEQRRRQVAENAGANILAVRLAEIARRRPDEIGQTESGWGREFGVMRRASVRVDTRGDLWRSGLRTAEQELRRALSRGFTADEVKLQVRAYENALQENLRTAPTRTSAQLAHVIRSALEFNFVPTSPETDLALAGPAVAALTPEVCAEAFRGLWAGANRRIAIVGFQPAPPSAREIQTAYEESAYAAFLRENDARAITPFDYTDFGPPGTIARRAHDERIDVHSVTFANGVKANLKVTDYEKGRVQLRVRLGRGRGAEPAQQTGLSLVTEGSFIPGGLGRYDNAELSRRLAGDTLAFSFTVEEDGFYFTGFSSPDALPRLLEVITAFITDPAFRPEGFKSGISQLQSQYPNLYREPTAFLNAFCPRILASGDPHYGLPAPEDVAKRTSAEVVAWLQPVLARAPIEIGVAGDFEIESGLREIARTLGALPAREPAAKLDPAQRPKLPDKSLRQVIPLGNGDPTKAAIRLHWPGVDDDDYRTSRRLQVLAEILNDRLRVKIREELGATYGPQDDVWGSNLWPGYGYLYVQIETAPALAERVANLTLKIAAELATRGVTQDEFERVLQPRLASLPQELRNNAYWTHHVLCRLQDNPGRASWPLTRSADYHAMRREEIDDVARRFLAGGRSYTFIARPQAPAK